MGNNGLPLWASEDASNRVSQLLETGESETIEFKECIPDQANKVTKEITAFATSGGGSILLGVNSQGKVTGLGTSTPSCRESIVDRITGLWGNMNPIPKGIECEECYVQGEFVLLITIPKQSEPAFFYNDSIYIRDHKISRPASPEEIKDIYFNWAKDEVLKTEEIRSKQIENEYSEMRLQSLKNIQDCNHTAQKNFIEANHAINKRFAQ